MIGAKFIRSWMTKKRVLVAASTLLAVATIAILYYVLRPSSEVNTPEYTVVLPQNRSVDDLGGWQRVSPPSSDPVYAYSDSLDDVTISVSQQPIPESFRGNVAAEVEQLAKSYNATTVIKAGETPVYIGRSSKGPQSVIFAKNDTLVLIKSQGTIEQESWINYVSNLSDPTTQTMPSF